MRMSTIDRVLIVEDHGSAAKMLRQIIESVFDSSTIVVAETLAAGMRAISEYDFQLALIDLGLPDGRGVDLIEVLAVSQTTFIVVTTTFDDDEHLFQSLRAGAQGYLLKGQQREALEELFRGILTGAPPLSPSIAMSVLAHFREAPVAAETDLEGLTAREIEVLQLIARGCKGSEVASLLAVARSTVASHIKSIYQKLDIHNRAEAAAAAVRLNLYKP
ncbi:MAG: DNA-binding NarL/FixJ family response regulator [Saprospiraceae bacterium]|jgi:DNA-binding NarL/FixJ family response regulator